MTDDAMKRAFDAWLDSTANRPDMPPFMLDRPAFAAGWEARENHHHSEMHELQVKLKDPSAVHINMLRGTIAKPSVKQIIHLYGADTLRAALAKGDDNVG